MEPLYLCVRSTLPWHDEAAVAAALVPELRAPVELWNATFDLRYAAFRIRLIEIAQRNLGRVENAKVARFEDVPPGALVVPVDDDDWFSPELAHRLLTAGKPDAQGYHWNRYNLEPPRRTRRWSWSSRRRTRDTSPHTCGTNNYAVRNLPELSMAVKNHVWASRHFDANVGRVQRLEASLSVQNRNLASRSRLAGPGTRLTRDALIEKARRYRKFYDRVRLPPEVAWAQPYAAAMAELMHSVRLR